MRNKSTWRACSSTTFGKFPYGFPDGYLTQFRGTTRLRSSLRQQARLCAQYPVAFKSSRLTKQCTRKTASMPLAGRAATRFSKRLRVMMCRHVSKHDVPCSCRNLQRWSWLDLIVRVHEPNIFQQVNLWFLTRDNRRWCRLVPYCQTFYTFRNGSFAAGSNRKMLVFCPNFPWFSAWFFDANFCPFVQAMFCTLWRMLSSRTCPATARRLGNQCETNTQALQWVRPTIAQQNPEASGESQA